MSPSIENQETGRLAIVGCGSSGLITLKNAVERLPNWQIVCFEATDSIVGCWGNPYPGFVSTSTKYTTQFSCFQQFDDHVNRDGGLSHSEFFCDDEYGKYLTQFADHFDLHQYIRMSCPVQRISRCKSGGGWLLSHSGSAERFDQLVVCTGLAAVPQDVACQRPMLSVNELNHADGLAHICKKRIVVIGGGESAVDYADRLARPEQENEVYLSLKSGIRVSPRYHPIRGVPSDFLRNRLMLSIDPDMRNWIGERFVRARIRFQRAFERFFPSRGPSSSLDPASTEQQECRQRAKQWAMRLTKASKDSLFNMFHNKSDRFLQAVGDQRIKIIGPPTDDTCSDFFDFDHSQQQCINPDWVVPAVGYESVLPRLFDEPIGVKNFHLGCCHAEYQDLHLVGFARPIIGNIPSISEVQAEYVCGLIAGEHQRDADIIARHQRATEKRSKRYAKLNQDSVYPVEMFPYCDALASRMNRMPSVRRSGGVLAWIRTQLGPATTIDYQSHTKDRRPRHIYMPWLLIALLGILWPISRVYRWVVGEGRF